MTEITLNTNNNNDNNFNISNDLEWNKKKQDMIINLGLTTNHVETDQTPTPTRFIRNCEKVGLFQDLQHVNPFDEEFAKAIQNSNQLNVHSTLINDSLHTPQPEIYEQIENSSKYNTIENNNDNVSSSSSSAATHQYPQYNDEIEEEEEEAKPLIIVVEDAENKHLKEEKIKITHLNNKNNNNREKEDLINKEKKLIQKEALRAAQNRCRKRKQRLFEEMKLENQNLIIKNAKLEEENFNLANRLQELETQLKAFHKNNFSTLPPPSSSSASASPTIKRIIKNTTNNNNNNQKIGEITEILKPIAPKYSIPTKNKKNTILFVYPPQIIVTTPREGGNYSVNMTKPES